VDQRLVQPDERVRPAGVPHLALRRVAVVANPDVRRQLFELVATDDIIAIADHLQHQQVPPVAQHERLRPAVAGVEFTVEPE